MVFGKKEGEISLRWIYKLERKLGRHFGVTNLMMYVSATILGVYLFSELMMRGLPVLMFFSRAHILAGEFWRIITFAFLPPVGGTALFVLIGLFVAYRIGASLEYAWGKTLFTMYIIFGVIGAIIAGFISGGTTNYYIFLSLILAFCYIHPNATFLLFFILPVKAKHIAIINWAFFAWEFITGNFVSRTAIVFSLINFFLFFGPDIWKTMQQNYNTSRRRREYQKNWGNQNPWR
jgi:hypothetical protein